MDFDPGRLAVDGWTRRALLGGAVTVGAVGFLGLQLLGPASETPPNVPAEQLQANGWTRTNAETESVERQVGPLTVTSVTTAVEYENRGLVDTLRERPVETDYRGERSSDPLSAYDDDPFGDPIWVFSAARIDLSPDVDDVPGGLGLAEVMAAVEARAAENFATEMRDAGLSDVRRTETGTLDVGTGDSATLVTFAAAYPFEAVTVDTEGGDVTLPGKDIDVRGQLAVWKHGDGIIVAGGAHPNENYAETVTETDDTGADITVSLDLGLDPDSYRTRTRALIREVR
jgi:hypothetical protein